MLTKFIVRGLKPISIVREKGFKEFCEAMDPQYGLPTAETLRNKYIPTLDKEVMDKVRNDLNKVNHVAVTSDGWSSNVSNY